MSSTAEQATAPDLFKQRVDEKIEGNPDMPVFTLIADDPLAPHLIRTWAALAKSSSSHQEPGKIENALLRAEQFERYQTVHNVGSTKASQAPAAWPFPVAGNRPGST